MQISLLFLMATLTSPLLLAPVFGEVEKESSISTTESTLKLSATEFPSTDPTAKITLQSSDLAYEKETEIDADVKTKCQQTNYRSYVECLLRETKRKKRQCASSGLCQGYQQCFGTVCLPVVQPLQPCQGSACIQIQQQPCSGFGCVFVGYNCLGSGCIQIGQTCYGVGCAPTSATNCVGPSCPNHLSQQPVDANLNQVTDAPSLVEGKGAGGGGGGEGEEEVVKTGIYQGPTAEDVSDLRREIEDIREQLRQVKEQNEKLIEITEKATTLILAANNKTLEPTVQRETVLLPHNLTTNIDISNYLNPTNVINVPKPDVQTERPRIEDVIGPAGRIRDEKISDQKTEETRKHCCIVVRPKTCRTSSRAPYFICGHRKYRTCGTHCSGKRVVHSHVKPECTWNSTGGCVSYHSAPYAPLAYPGYPVSGYYPPVPSYYPVDRAAAYYPVYAQPSMPIYAPPPPVPIYGPSSIYPSLSNPYIPVEEPEEVEECEDCETEIVIEDCDETTVECKPVEDKRTNPAHPNTGDNSHSEPGRGDTISSDLEPINENEDFNGGSKILRSNPLAALREVKNEAAAIKRSEDQLAASLDMLEEAVELKRLEAEEKGEEKTEKKSVNDIKTVNVDVNVTTDTP